MSETSEAKVIEQTDYPLTAQSLAEKLRACGMAAGQTMVVHLSMSKLGWVVGGAEAVILAFLAVLGEEGTLFQAAGCSGFCGRMDGGKLGFERAKINILNSFSCVYQPILI